jgi:glutamate formiminotransferase
MNLTDFDTTSLRAVFDAVHAEAAAAGVEIESSEIVGLIPRRALPKGAVRDFRIRNFHPDVVLETRLERVLAQRQTSRP